MIWRVEETSASSKPDPRLDPTRLSRNFGRTTYTFYFFVQSRSHCLRPTHVLLGGAQEPLKVARVNNLSSCSTLTGPARGLIRFEWSSEGSLPAGTDHRATALYSVGPSGPDHDKRQAIEFVPRRTRALPFSSRAPVPALRATARHSLRDRDLTHQHVRRFDANADHARQRSNHRMRLFGSRLFTFVCGEIAMCARVGRMGSSTCLSSGRLARSLRRPAPIWRRWSHQTPVTARASAEFHKPQWVG